MVRVKAPWIKHFYFTGLNSYILPNVNTVVLGGTTQKNSWDSTVSQKVGCPLMMLVVRVVHDMSPFVASSLSSVLSLVLPEPGTMYAQTFIWGVPSCMYLEVFILYWQEELLYCLLFKVKRLQDKKVILDNACKLAPSLRHAEHVQDWVGLRPYREPVRLHLHHHKVRHF